MPSNNPLGGYYIRVPRSQNAKREAVFSRPIFALADYLAALRKLLRHESLLAFKMPPQVWRFLIMSYAGDEKTLQRAVDLGIVRGKVPITPREGELEKSFAQLGLELEEDLDRFGKAAANQKSPPQGGYSERDPHPPARRSADRRGGAGNAGGRGGADDAMGPAFIEGGCHGGGMSLSPWQDGVVDPPCWGRCRWGQVRPTLQPQWGWWPF